MNFFTNFVDQTIAPWLQNMVATNAPVLPLRWLTQVNLALGWSVVLAWLGVWALRWYWARQANATEVQATAPLLSRHKVQIGTAAVLALWALVPGPWSPTYWLGLAFQAPSVVSVLLCGVLLHRTLMQKLMPDAVVRSSRLSLLAFAIMGVVLGWVLLLDTFAVLPVQLYAWGFSPAAVAVVALATALPWAISLRGPLDPLAWTAPLAVALFVLLRLPSGNVLDPWLWVVLQVILVKRWRAREKKEPQANYSLR
jgi:hypothetical protein